MWLNCKVIKIVATPPFLHQPPPFQVYPPFLAKNFVSPPKWLNFWKVLPLPHPLIRGEGGKGSNYVDRHWHWYLYWLKETISSFLYSFFMFSSRVTQDLLQGGNKHYIFIVRNYMKCKHLVVIYHNFLAKVYPDNCCKRGKQHVF